MSTVKKQAVEIAIEDNADPTLIINTGHRKLRTSHNINVKYDDSSKQPKVFQNKPYGTIENTRDRKDDYDKMTHKTGKGKETSYNNMENKVTNKDRNVELRTKPNGTGNYVKKLADGQTWSTSWGSNGGNSGNNGAQWTWSTGGENNGGQQWSTSSGGNGQQWSTTGGNGKQWSTTSGNSKQWSTTGGNEKQWSMTGGNGQWVVVLVVVSWVQLLQGEKCRQLEMVVVCQQMKNSYFHRGS